ncbi:MAG: hypothetical protein U9N13_06785 [Euryarchaeota archaeon]|nr:hypothetical protein [Euryarchaeota archaeon]
MQARPPEETVIEHFTTVERDPNDARRTMPFNFSKLETDQLGDIGRKLDEGVMHLHMLSVLPEIQRNVSVLPEMKDGIDNLNVKFDAMNSKFDTMNSKFDRFIDEQREHNKSSDKHNMRLEQILQTLVDKV